ncbi:MAG: NUDIX domain-containing protein [Actinomycetota bacterium]
MAARTHLTLVFDDATVGEIGELRRRFDPTMARWVPPHVTLVYPEEHHGDLELLLQRTRRIATGAEQFLLRLGDVVTDGDAGEGGVFVAVDDASGSWSRLRSAILTPPMSRLDVEPHLTVVHPRTSNRGPTAFAELASRSFGRVLVSAELCLTVSRSDRPMELVERIALRFRGHLAAGVILVDGDRVLLGHRHPSRERYPDAWDMVGGRIESGEQPLDTIVREAAEEIGVVIRGDDLRFVDCRATDEYQLAVFAIDRWDGEPVNLATDEHDAIAWHHLDDLDSIDLVDPAVAEACRAAVALFRR